MSGRLSGPRLALGLGIIVAVGIVAFLLLSGGNDSGAGNESGSKVAATGRPQAATLDQVRDVANSVGHTVYWAGEQPGFHFELTVDPDGKVYIRYLAEGSPVGSGRVTSLTIGTYPYIDAFGTLQTAARRGGGMTDRTPDDGLVVSFPNSPNNVYVAFQGSNYEIEVYDPHPGRALELATAGSITPIE